ncbi:hypothetical protein ABZP36_011183 [Zizania latifolia]
MRPAGIAVGLAAPPHHHSRAALDAVVAGTRESRPRRAQEPTCAAPGEPAPSASSAPLWASAAPESSGSLSATSAPPPAAPAGASRRAQAPPCSEQRRAMPHRLQIPPPATPSGSSEWTEENGRQQAGRATT